MTDSARDDAVRLGLKALRYGLGLLALAWVASQVEVGSLPRVLGRSDPLVLLALAGLTLGEFGARFLVWHVLFARVGERRLVDAANTDLVIRFVNHLLPSRLSGRAVAPLVIRHYTGMDWSAAVALAGAHTGLHALLYGAVAAVGVGLTFQALPVGLGLVIALSTAAYLVVGALIVLTGYRVDAFGRLVERLEPSARRLPKVGEWAGRLASKAPSFAVGSAAVFRTVVGDPRVSLPYALGWSLKIAVFPAIRVVLLLSLFGVDADPLLLPFVLVMAYGVTLLPLTPGGIGVAEASATLVFTSLGFPGSAVAPVILADRFLGVYVAALVGWVPAVRLDFRELASMER